MKKKQGLEALSKLGDWILVLALVIAIVLFIYLYIIPGFTEVGKTGEGFFDALKGIKVSYDTDTTGEKLEETAEERVEKADGCAAKAKELEKLNEQEKNKLAKVVLDKCLEEKNCDLAKEIIEPKDDASNFNLAKCYADNGDITNFNKFKDQITDEKLKNLLGKENAIVAEKQILNEQYKVFLGYLNADANLAKQQIEAINKATKTAVNKNYFYAAQFLLLEKQKNCAGLEGLGLEPQHIFPAVGPYQLESIESRRLFALIDCYKQDTKKSKGYLGWLVLTFPKSRATTQAIKDNMPECNNHIEPEGCRSINLYLLKPAVTNDAYKSLTCIYNHQFGFFGASESGGSCSSCSNVKSCSDYLSQRDCEEDTCEVLPDAKGGNCIWDRVYTAWFSSKNERCVASEAEKGY